MTFARLFLSGFRTGVLLLVGLGSGYTQGGTVDVSTDPPGGLEPEEVPQMILITFDDAVHQPVVDLLALINEHENPDGSSAPFTFFVSTDFSDYYLIHRLHRAGHEIAVHTMTHSTGTSTGFDTWIREIEGCREALSRYADIPREEIRGFRAPFLAHNGAMYEALDALGFSWSSSVLEQPGLHSPDPAHFIWPYTLHDGLKQFEWQGTGSEKSLPGLMEVPMWVLAEGTSYYDMDPGASGETLFQLLKQNFQTRYNGNRTPLGIWLHAATWLNEGTAQGLNNFLAWALEQPDTWVVTGSMLERWVCDTGPRGCFD